MLCSALHLPAHWRFTVSHKRLAHNYLQRNRILRRLYMIMKCVSDAFLFVALRNITFFLPVQELPVEDFPVSYIRSAFLKGCIDMRASNDRYP